MKSFTQDVANLLVKLAQKEINEQHGDSVYVVVTAWHVKLGKRKFIISLQEVS